MKKGIVSRKRARRLQQMKTFIDNSDVAVDYSDVSQVFGVSPAQASLDLKDLLANKSVSEKKVFYGKTMGDIDSLLRLK